MYINRLIFILSIFLFTFASDAKGNESCMDTIPEPYILIENRADETHYLTIPSQQEIDSIRRQYESATMPKGTYGYVYSIYIVPKDKVRHNSDKEMLLVAFYSPHPKQKYTIREIFLRLNYVDKTGKHSLATSSTSVNNTYAGDGGRADLIKKQIDKNRKLKEKLLITPKEYVPNNMIIDETKEYVTYVNLDMAFISTKNLDETAKDGDFYLYYDITNRSKKKDGFGVVTTSYICHFELQPDENYMIKSFLTAKSFYTNEGEPNGHASIIPKWSPEGNSTDENLISVKVWKQLLNVQKQK